MENEKQRERLVELLDNLPSGELLTKDVADYLLANNVVVLPLKVGDTIYRLDTVFDKVIDFTIALIDIYEDEVVYCDDSFNVFTDEEIGEGVFLTREEAEKALAKRKEKANENHTE